MTSEKWLQVELLYHSALERDPAERAGYLAEACNGDSELRDEVQALLNYDNQAESFIEVSALELVAREIAAERSSRELLDSPGNNRVPRQIGKYRLLDPIGRGGMGEVYLAMDTRLNRKVAIKLLPAELSSDFGLVRRFEQEAQAVSALNHPNVVTIFEFGNFEDRYYIVTEFVDGETLLQRVKTAPGNQLRLLEALNIAGQIANALQAAHKAGIVHRDIKLENVMVRPDGLVKVLDFGLAKSVQGPSIVTNPNGEGRITNSGIVMGTVDYMSPEQMRGERVDYRTDIFSLGVMLYELLSGKSPFEGATTTDVMVAVLSKDPVPLCDVAPDVPQALQWIVARCLEKKPEDRFQSAADLAFALQAFNPASTADVRIGAPTVRDSSMKPTAPATWRRLRQVRFAWPAASILMAVLLTGAILAVVNYRKNTEQRLAATFAISLPATWGFQSTDIPAVSPDGKFVVFSATQSSSQSEQYPQLWLRGLDSADAKLIPGTDGGVSPFWSPNSRYVAFQSKGALKKIDIVSGSVTTLCEANTLLPGTWGSGDDILFSSSLPSPESESVGPKADGSRIRRVSDTRGEPTDVRPLVDGERAQYNPRFLPDGKHFLYYSRNQDSGRDGIYAASLDQRENRKLILKGTAVAEYVSSGYLLFNRGNTLLAQQFSAGSLEMTGEAIKVVERAASNTGKSPQAPYAAFSVSDSGVLVWRTQTENSGDGNQLIWYDRSGKLLSRIGDIGRYSGPSLSPDETHLAVAEYDEKAKSRDIWIINLTLGAVSRLTSDPADEFNPAWSADGKWIYYTSTRKGSRNIYRRLADGSGQAEAVLESEDDKNVEDTSSDGRFLIFNWHPQGKGEQYLSVLSLKTGGKQLTMASESSRQDQALFSPDSRFVAYRSNETNGSEILIRKVAPGGGPSNGKWLASKDGGLQPRWRGDGKELFYLKNNILMSVDVVNSGTEVSVGSPRALFKVNLESDERRNKYLVTKDGQHFLVVAKTESTTSPTIDVKLDWLAKLKR